MSCVNDESAYTLMPESRFDIGFTPFSLSKAMRGDSIKETIPLKRKTGELR